MDRVRAEGRLGWLGADGHLTGELVLDCLIAVRSTLARIASGGMRDQVRGGIARYSVDRQWFVPHFEKMLYDNALYLRAAVAWAKVERALDPGSKWLALAEREIADTANFLISDLSAVDGFIAALDADSLNSAGVSEEGAAYVFTPEEFAEAGQAGLLGLVDSPAGVSSPGRSSRPCASSTGSAWRTCPSTSTTPRRGTLTRRGISARCSSSCALAGPSRPAIRRSSPNGIPWLSPPSPRRPVLRCGS